MDDTAQRPDIVIQGMVRALRQAGYLVPYPVMVKAMQGVTIEHLDNLRQALEPFAEHVRVEETTYDLVVKGRASNRAYKDAYRVLAGGRPLPSATARAAERILSDPQAMEYLSLHLIGHDVDTSPDVNWTFSRTWRINEWRKRVQQVVQRLAQRDGSA